MARAGRAAEGRRSWTNTGSVSPGGPPAEPRMHLLSEPINQLSGHIILIVLSISI